MILDKYKAVTQFGSFVGPLRNIRLTVDEMSLTVDLIPSASGNEYVVSDETYAVESILKGTSEVTESTRFLRLEFDQIAGLTVHEEFVEHVCFSEGDTELPKIGDSKAVWPLQIVEESPWKKELPDYRGGDDDDMQHFRIFSMTTYVDVLAFTPTGEWMLQKLRKSKIPNYTH